MDTQNAQILKALKQGKRLSPMEALTRYGTFRLAARIHELRGKGHRIKTHRHPGGWAVYSL